MTHRKWTPGALMAKAYRDITEEHNATVDAWQQAAADVDRLAAINGDLCDEIAALRGSIRVPFSDAQIEKMAAAAFQTWNAGHRWANAIRAALAAGGLEPCAVPLNTERASDDELVEMGRDGFDRFYDQECGDKESIDAYYAAIRAVRSRVEAPLLAEIQRLKSEPTGRDVAGLRARIENQRMTLCQLREARERDAVERMKLESEFVSVTAERDKARAELDAVKAERDELRNRELAQSEESWAIGELALLKRQIGEMLDEYGNDLSTEDTINRVASELAALRQPIAIAYDEAEEQALPDSSLRQRDAVPVKVMFCVSDERIQTLIELGTFVRLDLDKVALLRETFAQHAVIDAPAGVPSVEELADIIERAMLAYEGQPDAGEWPIHRDEAIAVATAIRDAVLAGLGQTPHAAPTDAEIEALARVLDTAYETEVGGHTPWRDQSPCHQDRRCAQARAAFAHIWRVPLGAELDVHPDQLELYKWVTMPDGGYTYAAQQAIDLCRSRIKPVYECKECAKRKSEMKARLDNLAAATYAIRAALEGE